MQETKASTRRRARVAERRQVYGIIQNCRWEEAARGALNTGWRSRRASLLWVSILPLIYIQ